MTTDRHWHLVLDREIAAQDRRHEDQQTRSRLNAARAVYLQALQERLNFLDGMSRGW